MSLVADEFQASLTTNQVDSLRLTSRSHVRRLDFLIDALPSQPVVEASDKSTLEALSSKFSTPRSLELLSILKSFSATSSRKLLSLSKIEQLLLRSEIAAHSRSPIASKESNAGVNLHGDNKDSSDETSASFEDLLEWLIVSKAAVQTYGAMMKHLMRTTTPLKYHMWYWDQVLGSYIYSILYMMQTSPSRFWDWIVSVARATNDHIKRLYDGPVFGERPLAIDAPTTSTIKPAASTDTNIKNRNRHAKFFNKSLRERWRQFYHIVKLSIAERTLGDFQRRIKSPLTLCRSEAREKREKLELFRANCAFCIGVLYHEAFDFERCDNKIAGKIRNSKGTDVAWKSMVQASVRLMGTVLEESMMPQLANAEFDNTFQRTNAQVQALDSADVVEAAGPVAEAILEILRSQLPSHQKSITSIMHKWGRPSRITRYWIPVCSLLFSSTTLWRLFINRRQEIVGWITDVGQTSRDFWLNWVIEPVRKVIGTIRHDSNGEIAIMSRDSLRADRESLERMVVEFARDKPSIAINQRTISEDQLAIIQAKVREGDVTPVLRAYEHDLKRPLMGAIRGDLVRALLIQIQKTKVDLEVALNGIDSLLKSQELVFGFVGLTPGLLVIWGLWQYLREAVSGRKGFSKTKRATRYLLARRNVDRELSMVRTQPASYRFKTTPPLGALLYRHQGVLLCEGQIMRHMAHGLLPAEVEQQFLEDLQDLINVEDSKKQLYAHRRIGWAYSKWIG